MRTYAVSWREGEGIVCSGKLELGRDRLRLEGVARTGGAMALEMLYREIMRVHVGRAAGERIDGRASIIISGGEARSLLITSVTGLGMNREIEEQLSAVAAGDPAR